MNRDLWFILTYPCSSFQYFPMLTSPLTELSKAVQCGFLAWGSRMYSIGVTLVFHMCKKVFFVLKMFIWKSGRQRQRQPELPFTGLLPKCLQCPGLGAKTGNWEPNPYLPCGGMDPTFWIIISFSPQCASAGRWNWEWSQELNSGTPMWDADA